MKLLGVVSLSLVIVAPTLGCAGGVEVPAGTGAALHLVDAQTKSSIDSRAVRVYSDNGVRCVTTPCDTNGREWRGRSDGNGYVFVPRDMLDVSMSLDVDGYRSVGLGEDARSTRPVDLLLERTQ